MTTELKDFILGVDLGQTTDPTTFVLVSRHGENPDDEWCDNRHCIVWVDDLPLNTPYPEVVRKIVKICNHKELAGRLNIAADMTGVGRAVMDSLREESVVADIIWGLTYTSGRKHTRDGMDFGVPKKDLVGALQMLLHKGTITYHPSLKNSAKMCRQMFEYTVKKTVRSNVTFDTSSGNHDDIVTAMCNVAWLSQILPIEEYAHHSVSDVPYTIMSGLEPSPRFGKSWRDNLPHPTS